MPTLPKWLANGTERVFSHMMHSVSVVEIEYLQNQLKRVRFQGDLQRTRFAPGKVIEFRINDTEFRHYTPSLYDTEAGICEVLFYLHGCGPGSAWADHLRVGDRHKLMGPGGKMAFQPEAPFHFTFGDETALGLCLILQNAAMQAGKRSDCILELAGDHFPWPEQLGLKGQWVSHSAYLPGEAALDKINHWEQTAGPAWSQCAFYLSGQARSIQLVRDALRQRGISPKQIITLPYWAKGKKGL